MGAGLSIISAVSLVLFYALEVPAAAATGGMSAQIMGTLNDITSVLQFLFMLPLTVALHQLAPARYQRLSQVASLLGAVGLLTLVIAQALLVARAMSFAVNLPIVMGALVLLGTWMLVADHIGRVGGALPRRLAQLGGLAGVLFVLLGAGVLLFMAIGLAQPQATANAATFVQQSPLLLGVGTALASGAFLALGVGELIWLIWLGRRLSAAGAIRSAYG